MESEEKLNVLDRNSGDGDTGTTFTRGAKGTYMVQGWLYRKVRTKMALACNTLDVFSLVIDTKCYVFPTTKDYTCKNISCK